MKKLILLLGAFALSGCGDRKESGVDAVEAADSSADSQAAGNQTEESSADTAKPPPVELPVIELPSEESSNTPKSLSDADVERLLKEAVDMESLEERDGLTYHDKKPYSGWAKMIHDSGQVQGLGQFKDGKPDGLLTAWAENGQRVLEATYKDGMQDGPFTGWHENGQKQAETTWKDGEPVSAKFWNSKGEEVDTSEEAFE